MSLKLTTDHTIKFEVQTDAIENDTKYKCEVEWMASVYTPSSVHYNGHSLSSHKEIRKKQ